MWKLSLIGIWFKEKIKEKEESQPWAQGEFGNIGNKDKFRELKEENKREDKS